MNGKIFAFSAEVGAGLIKCDDGTQYLFSVQEWTLDTPPVSDMLVEFEPGQKHAFKVKPATK